MGVAGNGAHASDFYSFEKNPVIKEDILSNLEQSNWTAPVRVYLDIYNSPCAKRFWACSILWALVKIGVEILFGRRVI